MFIYNMNKLFNQTIQFKYMNVAIAQAPLVA